MEAKHKADDAWRGMGNGENEEEVDPMMMLSAEASLECEGQETRSEQFRRG